MGVSFDPGAVGRQKPVGHPIKRRTYVRAGIDINEYVLALPHSKKPDEATRQCREAL